MERTKGTFTVSRIHAGGIDDYVRICISNGAFRHLIEVDVSLADFASALTGLGYVPADLTIYNKPMDADKNLSDKAT